MPFVPLTDGAEVEILLTLGGVVIENHLWFVSQSPPVTLGTLQNLSDGVALWYSTFVLPLLSQDVTCAAVVANDAAVPRGTTFAFTTVNISGGTASPSYSANVAVLVPFRWPIGFREKRNANYVPGIPDSAVTLNTVDITWSEALFDAYVEPIDLAPTWGPFPAWRWVNVSAWDGGVLRTEQLWGDVEGPSFVQPFKLGQQRRRLR